MDCFYFLALRIIRDLFCVMYDTRLLPFSVRRLKIRRSLSYISTKHLRDPLTPNGTTELCFVMQAGTSLSDR